MSVAEIGSILISASKELIIMWNYSYKQGFHAYWPLRRLLAQNLPRNTENCIFLYSPASWPHSYVLNSFYLGFSVGKNPNRIHLRNFYWIKRMARGDKGRRAFTIIIDFYLHCTDIPMLMYWYVLVEKNLYNLYCVIADNSITCTCLELSKGDKNLTLCYKKGNRWCKNSHTHKFTLFYDTGLLATSFHAHA